MKLSLQPTALMAGVLLIISGCPDQTPSRDHIPVLKRQVYRLQEAVKARDRTVIDSLLSPDILSHKQDSDSLIRFVYGPNDDFAFERFGDCEIVYTSDRARVECFVMDSTGHRDRPLELTLIYRHEMWLLSRFEPGEIGLDSLWDETSGE